VADIFELQGTAVLAYRKTVIARHVSRAVPCGLAAAPGMRGMVVNATSLMSEIGNALASQPGEQKRRLHTCYTCFTA
jgi:hypothetical protein